MTDDELRNLQFYIGKRDGNQTDEQVIKHIDEVNASAPLTDDEWHKLLYPCCIGFGWAFKDGLRHGCVKYNHEWSIQDKAKRQKLNTNAK